MASLGEDDLLHLNTCSVWWGNFKARLKLHSTSSHSEQPGFDFRLSFLLFLLATVASCPDRTSSSLWTDDGIFPQRSAMIGEPTTTDLGHFLNTSRGSLDFSFQTHVSNRSDSGRIESSFKRLRETEVSDDGTRARGVQIRRCAAFLYGHKTKYKRCIDRNEAGQEMRRSDFDSKGNASDYGGHVTGQGRPGHGEREANHGDPSDNEDTFDIGRDSDHGGRGGQDAGNGEDSGHDRGGQHSDHHNDGHHGAPQDDNSGHHGDENGDDGDGHGDEIEHGDQGDDNNEGGHGGHGGDVGGGHGGDSGNVGGQDNGDHVQKGGEDDSEKGAHEGVVIPTDKPPPH